MTDNCPQCKRKFTLNDLTPTIVSNAHINGNNSLMCPLCYGDSHLIIHGVSWEPKGEIASDMFEEAKRQYPKWKKQKG